MNKNYSCKGRFLPYRQVNVFFSDTTAQIKKAFLVSLLLMASFWTNLYADGSKDLYPSRVTGNRAFLYSNNYTASGTTINSWPFKTLVTYYGYANVGETIVAVSSAQNVGNGRIKLIAPNGAEYITTVSATGQLPNRNGELAGPQYPVQGAGGNRYSDNSALLTYGQTQTMFTYIITKTLTQ